MVRTRTIKEAYAYFKEADPNTAVTENFIRKLLITGKVPCVKVGRKFLVTLEALEEYLNGQILDIDQDEVPNPKHYTMKW